MNNLLKASLLAVSCAGLLSCALENFTTPSLPKESVYGQIDGKDVKLYELTNSKGMTAKVTEYGAILVSVTAPDKNGNFADVSLGYDTLKGWLTNTSYLGATVGRYGNRIAHGKFDLDGKTYSLAKNNDPGNIPCHLHGGEVGYDKVVWTGKPIAKRGAQGVTFSYLSKDGEEGYPGNLAIEVTYLLNEKNELIWEATATTDKATPVNIVHHSYWNLTGNPKNTINDHTLQLEADKYLPTNAGLIPTGELASVTGTPMDFTTATPIGKRVKDKFEALKLGGGYDHCWALNNQSGRLALASTLHDPTSGRTMEILTNQPGIQFYGGNFMDSTVKGKKGIVYDYRTGLCLETQVYPDSPNQPTFPNCILKPGETYKHTMVHRFSAK